jgi:serine/threonine-protein kinase ULK/ATG1
MDKYNNMYNNKLGVSAPTRSSELKPKKAVKYSLSKKLGSGSYSKVYFAVDKYRNQFAVKRIDKNKLSPNKLDTFSKELTISKDLDHVNIVKCYETIKTDNYWNVVLEYCNLMTLHDHNSVLKSMRISEEKELFVKFYLIQLKNALEYLQNKNIIHRDLKPMNILFTQVSYAHHFYWLNNYHCLVDNNTTNCTISMI